MICLQKISQIRFYLQKTLHFWRFPEDFIQGFYWKYCSKWSVWKKLVKLDFTSRKTCTFDRRLYLKSQYSKVQVFLEVKSNLLQPVILGEIYQTWTGFLVHNMHILGVLLKKLKSLFSHINSWKKILRPRIFLEIVREKKVTNCAPMNMTLTNGFFKNQFFEN